MIICGTDSLPCTLRYGVETHKKTSRPQIKRESFYFYFDLHNYSFY